MSDRVTHETSLRLEAAGFPQPEIAFGQAWYDELRQIDGMITNVNPGVSAFFNFTSGGYAVIYWSEFSGRFSFAPTATDILKELSIVVFSHWFEFVEGKFQIRIFFQGGGERQYFHSNPAEACAAAWLEINEKK